MALKNLHVWALAALFAVFGTIACGGGDDDDDGTQTDTSLDKDTDIDTGTGQLPVDCPTTWENDTADYSGAGYDYDEGPRGYGFQQAFCHDATYTSPPQGVQKWVQAEAIHDICLPDEDNNTRCFNEWHNSPDHNVLFFDFSAKDCGPCKDGARGEGPMLEALAAAGWHAKWVTVLLEGDGLFSKTPPDQDDANYWKYLDWTPLYDEKGIHLEGPVMWDGDLDWYDATFADWWPIAPMFGPSFPTIFVVNPANMLIWDVLHGFAPPTDPEAFDKYVNEQIVPILSWCGAQDDACDSVDPATGLCVPTPPPALLVDTDSGN